MPRPSDPQKEWTVNVPISDLIKLVEFQQNQGKTDEELARIRLELSGLRNLYSEVLGVIGDLRRELTRR